MGGEAAAADEPAEDDSAPHKYILIGLHTCGDLAHKVRFFLPPKGSQWALWATNQEHWASSFPPPHTGGGPVLAIDACGRPCGRWLLLSAHHLTHRRTYAFAPLTFLLSTSDLYSILNNCRCHD